MKTSLLKIALTTIAFVGITAVNITSAQEIRTAEAVQSPQTRGATLERNAQTLVVTPESTEPNGELQIPRFAAAIREISWNNGEQAGLNLIPEQEHWLIKWSQRPSNGETILLDFDSRPLLVDELKPIQASGDGGFFFPANLAKVSGEKVRYEPQMHKNTVGYWTGKKDHATWSFQVAEAGKFNVGLLQGCGKGQGGSAAKIEFCAGDQTSATLEFEVLETGHFQNFQWRHLGTIELTDAGEFQLVISPNSIKKAALMDVRAVSLVRLPE